jgi:hypothetical protein
MTRKTLPQADLNAQRVMLDAWRIARKAAKRYGHPAKDFIAHSLRQAWARLKALQVCSQTAETNAPAHAVYTVCVDEILNRSIKLRDQLAVELYFTDLGAALKVKALLANAFTKPFIKTAKPCFA